jgi:hypothetical protein
MYHEAFKVIRVQDFASYVLNEVHVKMVFCDNRKSLGLAYQLGDVTAFYGHEG